jgi:hypothetical protein
LKIQTLEKVLNIIVWALIIGGIIGLAIGVHTLIDLILIRAF